MTCAIHSTEEEAERTREILIGARNAYGFVPNLLATMASAPALLKAYTTLDGLFEETSFDATERQVVLLTISRENDCEYCMATHTVIASMQKVPREVVEAIRTGTPINDTKLEALRRFTRSVVESRGWPAGGEMGRFLAAGYGPQQVLEVVLGVGFKTLSNYTNHIANIPLDNAFSRAAWSANG